MVYLTPSVTPEGARCWRYQTVDVKTPAIATLNELQNNMFVITGKTWNLRRERNYDEKPKFSLLHK